LWSQQRVSRAEQQPTGCWHKFGIISGCAFGCLVEQHIAIVRPVRQIIDHKRPSRPTTAGGLEQCIAIIMINDEEITAPINARCNCARLFPRNAADHDVAMTKYAQHRGGGFRPGGKQTLPTGRHESLSERDATGDVPPTNDGRSIAPEDG
jgi:hypothetical protein